MIKRIMIEEPHYLGEQLESNHLKRNTEISSLRVQGCPDYNDFIKLANGRSVFDELTTVEAKPEPLRFPMTNLYQNHGLLFRYPAAWNLTEEAGDGCVEITVAPGDTAYWTATILTERPEIGEVLEAAVDTYMELYDEVDVFDLSTEIAHHPGEGRDVEFVCFELLNRAELRAFRTSHCTVLISCQGTDTELEELQPMFDEITCSLEVPDGFLTEAPQRWVDEE